MNSSSARWLCAIALMTTSAVLIDANQATAAGNGAATLSEAAKSNRTTYLLFYRNWTSSAAAMAQTVKAHVAKRPTSTSWTTVGVTSAAEQGVVDRFGVSRAPMPMVFAVHPNGAVTGAFPKQVTAAQLTSTLMSPAQAACVKSLQQNELVLLHVQTSPQQSVPAGVREFQADPRFGKRTSVKTVQLADPDEAQFFQQLKINPNSGSPSIVFMAPPGVMVGKFAVTARGNDLAKALHAAGKCCSDSNCKHNH